MRLPLTRCWIDGRAADGRGGASHGRRAARLVAVAGAAALILIAATSSTQAAARYTPVRAGVLAAPLLAKAASGANPYTFVGMTSQFPCQLNTQDVFCGTLNIFMDKNMSRVKRALVGFEAGCNSPDHYFGATWPYSAVPATRSRHNKTAAFTGQASIDQPLDDGLTAHASASMTGKVTYGRKGSGTFQATITITDQSGQTIDTCTTGVLPYRAVALKRA
jgi:hypothetical protein